MPTQPSTDLTSTQPAPATEELVTENKADWKGELEHQGQQWGHLAKFVFLKNLGERV